jgi:peptide/nickel transport system substrate-binding protein
MFGRRIVWLRLLLALVLMLIIVAVGQAQDAGVNRIVYGLSFEPSGFDPHRNASAELGIPLRMVYDTLVYRDPTTGQFVPGLAESWEVSPDGLVYTFRLKQGVTFHDGTAFNAAAVAANFDRILSPDTASQKSIFMLGTYAGYEVVDEYTIRIVLAQPYSPLLDSLAQIYLGMASPAAFGAYSVERYQFHQVGTGPYEMVEYVTGDRLVLRRSPNYLWGPSFYQLPAQGGIDEIEFRFYTDVSTRALALEAGDVQVIGEIAPTDARALATVADIQLEQVAIPGQPLQFLMNTTRYPTNNRDVRQALLFGTNREAIVDAVFQRFSPVAWGPISAATAYYSAQVVGSYGFDSVQARGLMEGAGFVDADSNGYYDADDGDLAVDIIVPPWGLIPQVAQLMEDQWRTIGVRAILNPVPTRAALFEAVASGEYNLVAWYEFGVDPAFLSNYFSSSGAFNWTGYANPNLDSLLVQAAGTLDENARATLYAQLQVQIMQEALILPIRDYVNINGISNRILNLSFDDYGWFPLLVNASLTN